MIYDRPYIVLRCPYCHLSTPVPGTLRKHITTRHINAGVRNWHSTMIERVQDVEVYSADVNLILKLIKEYNQKQTARGNVKKGVIF